MIRHRQSAGKQLAQGRCPDQNPSVPADPGPALFGLARKVSCRRLACDEPQAICWNLLEQLAHGRCTDQNPSLPADLNSVIFKACQEGPKQEVGL